MSHILYLISYILYLISYYILCLISDILYPISYNWLVMLEEDDYVKIGSLPEIRSKSLNSTKYEVPPLSFYHKNNLISITLLFYTYYYYRYGKYKIHQDFIL